MTRDEIITILEDTGVLLDGHFLLTSGRHSGGFLQCSQVLQYPETAARICQEMAGPFRDMGVETVMGPALGGIILSYEVARVLGCRAVFTENWDGRMTLRRGFHLRPGERVLVVEDAVSTGGSIRKVLDVAREKEAQVVGVSVMVDRTAGAGLDFGIPAEALLTLDIKSYDPDECPLCREGVPLRKPKNL